MKKMFMSLPMRGLDDETIKKHMAEIEAKVRAKYPDEEIVKIDSFVKKAPTKECNIPVQYLSQSIDCLSEADIVVFGEGWENARGCKIEHTIAEQYEIGDILEEKDL